MENNEKTVSLQAQKVLNQVRSVIVGKDNILSWIFAAVLAKGNILLEDIPGVGKTTMALAFSKTLQLDCNRMQFTPDVLPSDVTGYSVPDRETGKMVYQPGAVLCNLFLADELNRATSRTQSALLEAMEEGQVTVDGVSHPVPKPFLVLATQNPTGAAGTQLLPDSQMDRFMIRLSLGYPSKQDEVSLIMGRQKQNPLSSIGPLMNREDLVELQEIVERTHVSEEVVSYIVSLIHATRNHPMIQCGASPRAALAVTALSKAVAQLRGRDFVVPEDVRESFVHVVAHRLKLSPLAAAENRTAEDVLREIATTTSSPLL
ncbi:MAG: MoxR family ATPase [Clostridia bacterium]|nr:MoxR family ATPase [Clostridia bacterium]